LCGDVKEPPVEALDASSVLSSGIPPAEHFKKMAGSGKGLVDCWEIGSGGVGDRENWHLMWLSCVLAGLVELAL
jgi:hypothetical protein